MAPKVGSTDMCNGQKNKDFRRMAVCWHHGIAHMDLSHQSVRSASRSPSTPKTPVADTPAHCSRRQMHQWVQSAKFGLEHLFQGSYELSCGRDGLSWMARGGRNRARLAKVDPLRRYYSWRGPQKVCGGLISFGIREQTLHASTCFAGFEVCL